MAEKQTPEWARGVMFALDIDAARAGRVPTVRLDGDVTVPEQFRVGFVVGGKNVELLIRAERGRARVSTMTISERDDVGISGVSVSKVPEHRLLEHAVAKVAEWLSPSWPEDQDDPVAKARRSDVARSATRRRVSDERLERVGAILRGGGDVKAVREAELVGERQAWRLIRAARTAGFAEEARR